MVTRIVICISSPKGRASAAEESNRANGIKHLQKRQDDNYSDDNADDKYDAVQGNEQEEIHLYRLQECLNEAADGGICDGQSHHDVSTQGKLKDDATDYSTYGEIDDGAVDICRHNNNSSKKGPLLLDDEAGTEETKRRKKTQICTSVGGFTNQSQHGAVCTFLSVDEKLSFPMKLANKGGRIGIYLPDERKARIDRFHAKRSTRVFKRRAAMMFEKSLPTADQGSREDLSPRRRLLVEKILLKSFSGNIELQSGSSRHNDSFGNNH
eukprot:scaffold2131_cov111-Skeletonema_marinoi.AAC.2